MKPKDDLDPAYAHLFPLRPGRGERTKLRLIRATIECLAEDGIEKLTFESVGKRVGINRAQVKYHFAQKEDLIDKAIDYIIATAQSHVVKKIGEASNWKGQIRTMIGTFFDWAESHPNQRSVLLYLYYSTSFNKERRAFHTKMVTMGFERVAALLKKAQKEKGWSDATVNSLAVSVWALCDGYMQYYLTSDYQREAEFYRKEALKAVERLLESQ